MPEEIITPSGGSAPPSHTASSDEPVVSGKMPKSPKPKNKKLLIILLAVIAVVILVIVLVIYLAKNTKSKPYGTIKLSNGKEIFLGETVSDLKSQMGNDLRAPLTDYYEYPGKVGIGNTLQAAIWADKNKVVAIRVSSNVANQQSQTAIHIDMPLTEAKTKAGDQAQAISKVVKYGNANGLWLKNGDVTSYYLVNPCVPPSDKVITFAVATKGYEEHVEELGAGCTVRGH